MVSIGDREVGTLTICSVDGERRSRRNNRFSVRDSRPEGAQPLEYPHRSYLSSFSHRGLSKRKIASQLIGIIDSHIGPAILSRLRTPPQDTANAVERTWLP